MSDYTDICKESLISKQPEGSLGDILVDGDEDKLYDGLAGSQNDTMQFLEVIKYARFPEKTIFVDELERDYGIASDASKTGAQRRAALTIEAYKEGGTGSNDDLRYALERGGFGYVNVYDNDPPIDPRLLMDGIIDDRCNEPMTSCCSDPMTATCSENFGLGEFIVNGDMDIFTMTYGDSCADPMNSCCSDPMTATCSYANYRGSRVTYNPTKNFALITWIGGEITRDVDGNIVSIARVQIPTDLRDSFRRIVLKYKPLDRWAAVMVEYRGIVLDGVVVNTPTTGSPVIVNEPITGNVTVVNTPEIV